MIIKLSNEFEEHYLSDQEINCLENLLVEIFYGHHILIASRSVFLHLEADDRLSRKSLAVVKKLLSEYSFSGKVRNWCSPQFTVSPGKATIGTTRDPLCELTLSSLDTPIGKSVLLAENLKDAKFYAIAAKVFLHSRGLEAVRVACEARGGGGNTIGEEFSHIVMESRRFCLCITDSDKLSPKASKGDNAKACSRVIRQSDWPARLEVTPGRELENLVPLQILVQLNYDPQVSHATSRLSDTNHALMHEILDFADIKKGYGIFSILKFEEAKPEFIEWSDYLIELERCGLISLDCWHESKCLNNSRKVAECKANCVILPPAGDSILKRVLSLIESSETNSLTQCLTTRDNDRFLRVGRTVAEFCSAQNPIRV